MISLVIIRMRCSKISNKVSGTIFFAVLLLSTSDLGYYVLDHTKMVLVSFDS